MLRPDVVESMMDLAVAINQIVDQEIGILTTDDVQSTASLYTTWHSSRFRL